MQLITCCTLTAKQRSRTTWRVNHMPGTDGDGTDDSTGSESTGDGGTDDSTLDGGADGGTSTTDDSTSKDPKIHELSQENARRRNENKTLRQQLEAANVAKKALEDKEKSDLDRVTGDLEAATAKSTALETRLRDLALENAFLASNKHQWRDPKIALRLADLSEVKIDDEGEVEGLDKALDKLAKDHVYLLKPKDDDDADSQSATGSKVKGGSSSTPNRDALEKKYPALRR